MADNVGYTPGTGATIAADEIDGVLHQRVKIGIGGDGQAVDISDANPVPVDVGSQSTLSILLVRILNALLAPLGYQKDIQRYRVLALLDSGSVATVTTVTTLTNLNGLASDRLITSGNQVAWALTHRARIT